MLFDFLKIYSLHIRSQYEEKKNFTIPVNRSDMNLLDLTLLYAVLNFRSILCQSFRTLQLALISFPPSDDEAAKLGIS